MEMLPDELIGEILQRTVGGTKLNARAVCRRWKEIVDKQSKPVRTAEDFIDACKRGDILSIISGNHKDYDWDYRIVWRAGIKVACKNGHAKLVNKMIDKMLGFGYNEDEINEIKERCLLRAGWYVHPDVVDVLYERFSYDEALIDYIEEGLLRRIYYVMDIDIHKDDDGGLVIRWNGIKANWEIKYLQAWEEGDDEMVGLMKSYALSYDPMEVYDLMVRLLEKAIAKGNPDVIEYLLKSFDYDDFDIYYLETALDKEGPIYEIMDNYYPRNIRGPL